MWLRVSGLVLRYVYLHRRSKSRLGEIFFWPVMNLLLWGFITDYMQRMGVPQVVMFFLGAMILWDMFYRAQVALSLALTEEMWVKNLINILIAPVSMFELVLAMCCVGASKALINAVVLGLLAYLLHAFNLLSLGFTLVPCFFNLLLFAWAIGMGTMAVIVRYGVGGEALAWGLPFLLQPFSAVFYPLDVLPFWLQVVALALPTSYIFESMRAVLHTGRAEPFMLLTAFGLNIIYLSAGAMCFGMMLQQARREGYLSRLGMH
jgi:ABC-2 type transport system permease protein